MSLFMVIRSEGRLLYPGSEDQSKIKWRKRRGIGGGVLRLVDYYCAGALHGGEEER